MTDKDALWPDANARHIYEAAMLDHHASLIAARYPDGVWPNAWEKPAPGSREAAAAQLAFVAGVRFCCDQLQIIAADLRESVDDEVAQRQKKAATP